ncbi:MAG: hypothetical protein B6244_14870 [Candidatus Cloacimonetes bacterium 4572_55]|nr:MAG: hypothetical protein B6244_14870 [Candidatus Cloacimonetes bacterium 4572_55]
MTLFTDTNDLAAAAGWIANQSGGWNTDATVSFLKNVAANWEFENINQILAAIGWVKDQAGSWTADATISFIAELMGGTVPIDHIDYWLTQMGIVDADLRRTMTVTLVYTMVEEGNMDLANVADYVYKSTLSAWMMAAGDPDAQSILRTMQAIGSMWGKNNAYDLGAAVNAHGSTPTNPSTWAGAWTKHGMPSYWAEGGIINSPTYGLVGEAGYPEAIIPMKDGVNIPVKWVNGGSTQQGSTDINITLEIDGAPLDVKIKSISGNTAESHRVNLVRWGKQNSEQRQPV